ncbi:hypothetical protein G9A89_021811 [Geosiphon pyriformis]|nr:hypothetical protein G9A89_021811 [Geosiphon pyriformis]
MTKAKSKKAAPDICPEISNKISIRKALSIVEATSNCDKLSLIATEATFLSLAGFSPVKVPSKRHTWVSLSVVSTLTKSPKVFNNRPVNKLIFLSIDSTPGVSSIISLKKIVKKTKSSEKWGQLLASAIVTPNLFVAKINHWLCCQMWCLPQFLPVGSPVLGNSADQMKTDSSLSLVFGATSGGAWETITSCQRFAGWMASTLVSGATFKIKLAHVKTVFQSVDGFLGTKSVSKDSVKLFCIEFASQVSLKAAFLVELTSSVHLATLKIAKSLVVSESGSPFAAVVLHDMFLDVSAADIKKNLSVFGVVTCVVLKPASIWQYVVVYFKNLVAVTSAFNYWSVLVGKDSVWILSLVNQQEAIVSHNRFKAKLVNLLSGCTAFEISNMISQVGGQTCFIPQSPDFGHCFQFVLVTFGSQAELDFAVIKTGTLRKCQKTGHLAVDCKMSLPSPFKTPRVFNFYFVSNVSYAKASATLSGSGFFLLVVSDLLASPLAAFTAASVVNSAIELRLNSMEKQILDLTALVKSVIEPIGSLVTLVTILLNNNAAKTLKVEKDLLTICNASKGFVDLLVGVSKDFANLKAKVGFGNLNENNIGVAKAFLLSEDTVDYAVALWQMCSSKVKDSIGALTDLGSWSHVERA